jgi:hypothetical protein
VSGRLLRGKKRWVVTRGFVHQVGYQRTSLEPIRLLRGPFGSISGCCSHGTPALGTEIDLSCSIGRASNSGLASNSSLASNSGRGSNNGRGSNIGWASSRASSISRGTAPDFNLDARPRIRVLLLICPLLRYFLRLLRLLASIPYPSRCKRLIKITQTSRTSRLHGIRWFNCIKGSTDLDLLVKQQLCASHAADLAWRAEIPLSYHVLGPSLKTCQYIRRIMYQS